MSYDSSVPKEFDLGCDKSFQVELCGVCAYFFNCQSLIYFEFIWKFFEFFIF